MNVGKMTRNMRKKLIKVQTEIQNPKADKINPFFKSRYAALDDILNQVRPLLVKNGLFLTQNTGTNDEGDVWVETVIFDDEDGFMASEKMVLKPDQRTPQKVGSAITYGRRYQLTALLGIVGEEDDDANTTNKTKPKTKKVPKKPVQKPVQKPDQPKSNQSIPMETPPPTDIEVEKKVMDLFKSIKQDLRGEGMDVTEITPDRVLQRAARMYDEQKLPALHYKKLKEAVEKGGF